MERRKSLFLALVLAGAIVGGVVGVSATSNTQAAASYDTSKLKIIEVAGNEETALVLKMLKREDAVKVTELGDAIADTVGKDTVFVISTDELKNKKDDPEFQQLIDKILKSEGVILTAGYDTDILRDIVRKLPSDSVEAQRRAGTPVMGYRFTEVPDEENPGETRFIVDEYHLGPPGSDLSEHFEDNAVALQEWVTSRDLGG